MKPDLAARARAIGAKGRQTDPNTPHDTYTIDGVPVLFSPPLNPTDIRDHFPRYRYAERIEPCPPIHESKT